MTRVAEPKMAPMRPWPSRALLALIRADQVLFSPMLGQNCRFEPSCSRYAMEVVQTHGAVMGSAWTVRCLLRCHPWHPGGVDPAPAVGTPFHLWRKS